MVGGALLADAVHDNAVLADLNRFAEQWVLPISPTHRRPQLFDATHPNFGGYMGIRVPPELLGEMKRADLMVALGERHDRLGQPVLQFPDRTPSRNFRWSMSGPTLTKSAACGGPISVCRAVRMR